MIKILAGRPADEGSDDRGDQHALSLTHTLSLFSSLSPHETRERERREREEREKREKKTCRTGTHFMWVYMANARADHDTVLFCFPSPTYHILTRR